jgi:hypothetical protein
MISSGGMIGVPSVVIPGKIDIQGAAQIGANPTLAQSISSEIEASASVFPSLHTLIGISSELEIDSSTTSVPSQIVSGRSNISVSASASANATIAFGVEHSISSPGAILVVGSFNPGLIESSISCSATTAATGSIIHGGVANKQEVYSVANLSGRLIIGAVSENTNDSSILPAGSLIISNAKSEIGCSASIDSYGAFAFIRGVSFLSVQANIFADPTILEELDVVPFSANICTLREYNIGISRALTKTVNVSRVNSIYSSINKRQDLDLSINTNIETELEK